MTVQEKVDRTSSGLWMLLSLEMTGSSRLSIYLSNIVTHRYVAAKMYKITPIIFILLTAICSFLFRLISRMSKYIGAIMKMIKRMLPVRRKGDIGGGFSLANMASSQPA